MIKNAVLIDDEELDQVVGGVNPFSALYTKMIKPLVVVPILKTDTGRTMYEVLKPVVEKVETKVKEAADFFWSHLPYVYNPVETKK